MNICGIVTEYNPMHLGHCYQLEQARLQTNADAIVLVMSGNFVQRGEPAIINKYKRAEAAIKAGVDLVIELPSYFSTASAEYFAEYAMRILDETNVITHLNFGSESGDIRLMDDVAKILSEEPIQYKDFLTKELNRGLSFPKARSNAIKTYISQQTTAPIDDCLEMLSKPNSILGIEYLKSLRKLNSRIIPTTTKRIGANYHDSDKEVAIPSATALREHFKNDGQLSTINKKIPSASYQLLEKAFTDREGPVFIQDIYPLLKHKILTDRPSRLKTYVDINEGLENRIYDAAIHSRSYDDLLEKIMTKRYTKTRLARTLLNIYLGHQQDQLALFRHHMSPYLRVLGFNDIGKLVLKKIKEENEDMPIIVNTRQGYKRLNSIQKDCYMADIESSYLYNLIVETKYNIHCKNDYQQPVVMI